MPLTAQQKKMKAAWASRAGRDLRAAMKKHGAKKAWGTPPGKKFKQVLRRRK